MVLFVSLSSLRDVGEVGCSDEDGAAGDVQGDSADP